MCDPVFHMERKPVGDLLDEAIEANGYWWVE